MKNISVDDVLLFGSVGLFATGTAFVALSVTGHVLLSLGLALIVFGPCARPGCADLAAGGAARVGIPSCR